MEKSSNSTALTLTLLLGILLQVLFVFADTVDTPNKTAVEFSKAYFKLDPAMANYLCGDLAGGEDTDVVAQFMNKAAIEASSRGVGIDYLKSNLYHINTHTLTLTQDSARIRITCKRRTAINPVYAIVAKIFFIGGTYPVDEVIELIRENGRWKVCGNPFSLT